MRLPELVLLLRKDWRELVNSRAYWLLLLMIGPLVGHGFITAVEAYAEASGAGGGPAALSQGLSPLDGILVPSFGAYDLAAMLLFPFIVIRLLSGEKQSGAWKLMLQMPFSIGTQLISKALVLMFGWLLAWIPGALAAGLWSAYGGSLYAPETVNLLLGHLLRALLSASVAVAAAAIGTGSSAAIAALGFTVGGWALEFVGTGRGGWLERLAASTPTAALRAFEQGQFKLSAVASSLLIGLAGFTLAGIWLHAHWNLRRRFAMSVASLAIFAVALGASTMLHGAWDFSEDRRNSFPAADEAALARITVPLRVTVYLAAEDPRWMDLNRGILCKLERILPAVTIEHASRSRAGLFEAPGEHYGEVWYELESRKVMSRSTTEPIVLEAIYKLAQMTPPAPINETGYGGHPLPASPTGAAWTFYLFWSGLVAAAFWKHFKA